MFSGNHQIEYDHHLRFIQVASASRQRFELFPIPPFPAARIHSEAYLLFRRETHS
jgi:hypothetical protein